MNSEHSINVHHSSLVGLRAELLRKQIEVEEVRGKLETVQPLRKSIVKNNSCITKQKKKQRNKLEQSEDVKSMKALEKSKFMLQAKSKLYDKLSKLHTNMNSHFLVDFEHKLDNSDYLDIDDKKKRNNYTSDNDPNNEWVEYTDCFGRARKCLQEDLARMREKDDLLKKNFMENIGNNDTDERVSFFNDKMLMKEPEMDIMRKKWEEQTAKLADKNNIHYQDILFDEARTHGVGYYAFSQDEDKRVEQQNSLIKLRKETEEQQKNNQEIRNVKKSLQVNRLKVAQMRKRIRKTLHSKEIKDKKYVISSDCGNQVTRLSVDNEVTTKLRDGSYQMKEIEAKETAKRDFDYIDKQIDSYGEVLSKSNQWYIMSQEEWLEKKRKERNTDFAPNYKNHHQRELLKFNKSKDRSNHNEFSQRNRLDTIASTPLAVSIDDCNVMKIIPPSIVEPTHFQSEG